MRFATLDRERLAQACEVLPPTELRPGVEVIIDGRLLKRSNPLAWRAGKVVMVERLAWAKGAPLLPRVDVPARAPDGARRREPIAATLLLRSSPQLLQTLRSLGLRA